MTAMPVDPAQDRRRGRACLAAMAALVLAMGASPAPAAGRTTPTLLSLGVEPVRLPGGETMGLVGGSLLFEAAPSWWAGPALYGAATGERGGLFVGGVELQRRWRLGARQWLAAGLFAGGGGGAAAPVGGGLMLRPALTWWRDLGGWQAGVGWSHVTFPSGAIDSHQLSVLLAWEGRFVHSAPPAAGFDAVATDRRTGIGLDRIAATATTLHLRPAAGAGARRVGLAGVRMERDADAGWTWTAEGAGAAGGDASGYMEVFAGAGWETALAPPWLHAGLRGAIGLGGGGAVPTGGGTLAKAALTLSARLSPTLRAGAEWGEQHALDSPTRGRMRRVWLSMALEPVPGAAMPASPSLPEWVVALQHHPTVRRRDGTTRPLATIGLKLNRFVGEHLYLSGQAHSAFGGGAGAYGIGLIGAGLATASSARGWQAGAELLAGAAGGGGVATGGGALLQALAWVGAGPAAGGAWRLGVGALRSRDGSLTTPVIELAWSWHPVRPAP